MLPTSKGKGLITGNVTMGNGQLRLMSTAGDLWGTRNNQDNALDVSFDTSRDFVMETRLTSFPFTKNWQNAGLFVGTGIAPDRAASAPPTTRPFHGPDMLPALLNLTSQQQEQMKGIWSTL